MVRTEQEQESVADHTRRTALRARCRRSDRYRTGLFGRLTVVFGGHSAAPATAQNPNGYPFYFNNLSPADEQVQATMTLLNDRAVQFYNEQEAMQPHLDQWSGLPRSPSGITSIAVVYTEHSFGITACQGVINWVNQTNLLRNGSDEVQVVAYAQIGIVDAITAAEQFTPFFQPLPPYDLDLLVVCGAPAQSTGAIQGLAASQVRPKAFAYFSDDVQPDTTDPTVAAGLDGVYSFGYRTAAESLPSTLPGTIFSDRFMVEDMYSAYAGEDPSLVVLRTLAAWETMISCVTQSYYSYTPLDSESLWFSFIYNKGRNFLNNVDFTGNDVSSQINTGFNQLIVTRQYGSNGTLPALLATASDAVYPTDWPWYRVLTGDLLVRQLTAPNVLIGCVFVILGAWVAVIIIEQAVFERRRGGWYQPWLWMVACALSGAGGWCSVWMQLVGVALYKANELDTALSISYSLSVALLSLLIGSMCSWAALMLAIRDVEDDSDRHKYRSETAQMRLQHKERKAAQRKLAALSHKAHALQLLDAVTWRVVLSGLLLAASIALQRYCLMWTLESTATWTIQWQAWVILGFTQSLLLPTCVLLYLHALRWRMSAVLLFAASVIVDLHVSLSYTDYYLADEVQYGSTTWKVGSSLSVSSLAVNLICGITAAATCFIFVSLQFSRMQLSRNGLALLVANLEHINKTLKTQLGKAQAVSDKLQQQADALVCVIETINICRPLPQEYAFAMALYSNTSTFRQQLTPLFEGNGALDCFGAEKEAPTVKVQDEGASKMAAERLLSPSSSNGNGRGRSVISPTHGSTTIVLDSEGTPNSSARRLDPAGSVIQLQPSSRSNAVPIAARQHSISVQELETPYAATMAVPESGNEAAAAATSNAQTEAEEQNVIDPPPGPASPAVSSPPAHRSQLAFGRATSPVNGSSQTIRVASYVSGDDREPVSQSSGHGGRVHSSTTRQQSSGVGDDGGDTAAEQSTVSVGAFSTTSLLGQAVYKFDHGKRCKDYEAAMHKQILAQTQHASAVRTQLEISAQLGQAKRTTGWDHAVQATVFSLTQPLSGLAPVISDNNNRASIASNSVKSPVLDGRTMALSVAVANAKRDTSASQAPPNAATLPNAVTSNESEEQRSGSSEWPLPSLAEMLLHPVCVELLKDALSQIHSEENLIFYLHVSRYRRLSTGKLRTLLANEIYDAFIREGAPQQININTRQREKIAAVIRKSPSEFPAALFLEAEREVRLLMETNLMKAFKGSERHRLCAWVMAAVPLRHAAGMTIAEQNNDTLTMANADGVHELPDEPMPQWSEHSTAGNTVSVRSAGSGGPGAAESFEV